jgi:hypothetical protein
MATEITLYGQPVHTVFDLLGDKENDITYSLGWALANSDRLTDALLRDLFPRRRHMPEPDVIRLQKGISGAGFTDIEIQAGGLHVVLEAKRGWNFPTEEQLRRYAERTKIPPTALLVTAEASPEFVRAHQKLPKKVSGVRVLYRSWQQIAELASGLLGGGGQHAQKRLIRELIYYLKGLMTMQNIRDNMVYVVSLGGQIEDTDFTYREVVVEHDVYFCPMGGGPGGWPRTPPNYLGFRFNGQLQQIRHVEDYEVREDSYAGFRPLRGKVDWSHEPHWLFRLGPVIRPDNTVKMGRLWPSQRVWAALDLLLTSDTVAEARDKTRERLEAAGEAV